MKNCEPLVFVRRYQQVRPVEGQRVELVVGCSPGRRGRFRSGPPSDHESVDHPAHDRAVVVRRTPARRCDRYSRVPVPARRRTVFGAWFGNRFSRICPKLVCKVAVVAVVAKGTPLS